MQIKSTVILRFTKIRTPHGQKKKRPLFRISSIRTIAFLTSPFVFVCAAAFQHQKGEKAMDMAHNGISDVQGLHLSLCELPMQLDFTLGGGFCVREVCRCTTVCMKHTHAHTTPNMNGAQLTLSKPSRISVPRFSFQRRRERVDWRRLGQ